MFNLKLFMFTRVDPAFVIRGGPNSEQFLSNLRKLLRKGKFFLTTQSLISEEKLSLYKNLFLIKKTYLILFWVVSF